MRRARPLSRHGMLALIDSLRSTIEGLRWTPAGTEWAEYATSHSYSTDALEAKRPKPRYYVTFPTYAVAFLRRVLPVRALERAGRAILDVLPTDILRLDGSPGEGVVGVVDDLECVERVRRQRHVEHIGVRLRDQRLARYLNAHDKVRRKTLELLTPRIAAIVKRNYKAGHALSVLTKPVEKVLGDRFGYEEVGTFDRDRSEWRWEMIPNTMRDKLFTRGMVRAEKVGDNQTRRIDEVIIAHTTTAMRTTSPATADAMSQ